MHRSRAPLALFTGLIFLLAGALGVHVHLCFDGSEPPASVHAGGSERLDHHVGGEHHDVDVEPVGELLAKSGKLDLPVLALVAALLLLLLPRATTGVAHFSSRPAVPIPPRRWRPPLRAPPV